MKRKLFSLLFIIAFQQMGAQEALGEVKKMAYGNPFNAGNENFINLTNALSDDQQVSLMMFDNWKSIEINGVNNELILIDSANYHMEEDKFLFVHHGGLYELYPEKIEFVHIDNHKFVNLTYEAERKSLERAYFEVLVDGDYILLSRRELVQEITNTSPLGLSATREVTYVLTEKLYYQSSSDRRPLEVPRKKADFTKIFRRDRSELADYAKGNKYSVKRTEDVISIFNFYNSMAD
ncbi:MAG: hypothetical protein DRI69_08750 [Bacteroidetes bacterium]|nr:MAG: hypothetical protein DRI69_08750 [Bacteroidota bacterium]